MGPGSGSFARIGAEPFRGAWACWALRGPGPLVATSAAAPPAAPFRKLRRPTESFLDFAMAPPPSVVHYITTVRGSALNLCPGHFPPLRLAGCFGGESSFWHSSRRGLSPVPQSLTICSSRVLPGVACNRCCRDHETLLKGARAGSSFMIGSSL